MSQGLRGTIAVVIATAAAFLAIFGAELPDTQIFWKGVCLLPVCVLLYLGAFVFVSDTLGLRPKTKNQVGTQPTHP
jgi:hypothetical protein